jgi:hypothetical protein
MVLSALRELTGAPFVFPPGLGVMLPKLNPRPAISKAAASLFGKRFTAPHAHVPSDIGPLASAMRQWW